MRVRIAGAVFFVVLVVAAVMLWREGLPVLRLADGAELRVLKVSVGKRHYFSEEKGWRQFALDFFPDKVLAKTGLKRSEILRPHGSLLLWVTKVDARNRTNVQPNIATASVQFGEDRWTVGQITSISSNAVQIEFPIYPRADRELKVRLFGDPERPIVKLKNPQPVKLQQWQADRLPKTNVAANMVVTLKQDGYELMLHARDPRGEAVGWMQWKVDVEDTAGNWDQFVFAGSRFRENFGSRARGLREQVFQPGPLKLTVRPVEYISAGFVTNRASGVIQEMEINERSAKLRIEKLFFLGTAEYLFANGIPRVHHGAPLGTNVIMATTNSANQWDVHIVARRPNLAAVYPTSVSVESFDARLRERTERGNGGAIYSTYRPANEARSFPPARLLRQFDIPTFYSTNAIQAEIIARHRPIEFIIEKSKH